jgi:hypothetical protein
MFRSGMSIRRATQKHGVPKSTLSDRLNGIVPIKCRKGPQTYLTHSEESLIAAFIINAQKRAMPVG